MWTDIRFALRTLRRTPGFAVLAILTLALGIGASTAVFSLLYQVVLRSVAARDPGALVNLNSDSFKVGRSRSDNHEAVFSYPMYRELRDRNQVFTGLIARAGFPVTLTFQGDVRRTMAEVVTGNFFDVLGLGPELGRLLQPYDDQQGHGQSVVLSYAYWQGAMGGDRSVVNRQVLINNRPVTVVGVAPKDFWGLVSGNKVDFYVPVALLPFITSDASFADKPDSYWLNLCGRLKASVSREKAAASLTALYRAIMADQLPRFDHISQQSRKGMLEKPILLESAAEGVNELRTQWEKPLVVLMFMVALVLAIACANVANLLIARSAFRQRETAVRIAIGATRFQLVRQLLVESVLLSVVGGLLGIAAAKSLTGGILAVLPTSATGGWLSDQMDMRVLMFGLVLSLLTGVLFGSVPALQFGRSELGSALKEQSNTVSASRGQSRLRWLLVAAQVCLSLLLLIGAGLFTRSLMNLLHSDPGFHAEHVITFSLDPSLNGYSPQRSQALFRDVIEKLKSIPGEASVSSAVLSPFGGANWGTGVKPANSQNPTESDIAVQENAVAPQYFETLGVPLVAGRTFADTDRAGSARVAVINEELAGYLFHGRNAVGNHLKMGPKDTDVEIVGVVRNSQFSSLREKPEHWIYLPKEQESEDFVSQSCFLIRTRGSEAALMKTIRQIVKQVDPNVPIDSLNSLQVMVQDSVYTDRLIAVLAMGFCILAMTLACIGLYGTISYFVTQRTREFGIRLALGARRSNIGCLIVREVAILVGTGAAVGASASFILARLIQSQLFGIRADDPWIYLAAIVVIAAASFAAGALPLLRAVRIEPLRALRYE